MVSRWYHFRNLSNFHKSHLKEGRKLGVRKNTGWKWAGHSRILTTFTFIICTVITIRRVDTTKFVIIVVISAIIAIGRVETKIFVIRTFKVNESKLNYDDYIIFTIPIITICRIYAKVFVISSVIVCEVWIAKKSLTWNKCTMLILKSGEDVIWWRARDTRAICHNRANC